MALQNLDVTFGIDRAGLVGEDGPTRAGAYDYAFMRTVPNMVIMAPKDENECRQMLHTAYLYNGPCRSALPAWQWSRCGNSTTNDPDGDWTGRNCSEL